MRGGGTDANVFVHIFGDKGDTGKLLLRSAENTKNMFERSRTDQFVLEAVDIGKVGVLCTVQLLDRLDMYISGVVLVNR